MSCRTLPGQAISVSRSSVRRPLTRWKVPGRHNQSPAPGMSGNHEIIRTYDTAIPFKSSSNVRCIGSSFTIEWQDCQPCHEALDLTSATHTIRRALRAIKQLEGSKNPISNFRTVEISVRYVFYTGGKEGFSNPLALNAQSTGTKPSQVQYHGARF